MNQIILREKTYEFRRFRIPVSVKRVWFYLNAPESRIVVICEIDPARTRMPGDSPLPEDGVGNREFNMFQKDWNGLDYAYRVKGVWALNQPLTLQTLKQRFGMKGPPRALMYVPKIILEAITSVDQQCIWTTEEQKPEPTAIDIVSAPQKMKSMKRKLTEEDISEVEPQKIKRRRSLRLSSRCSLLKTSSCDAMDVD
ncbi:hypothetical protein E1B28_000191 [Marasmius oreades]|uniref:Uncharacterized protein n=1 Tax=Marasmius oreades TaxID=181124 RepID=A0A9P7V0W1_9AGAR|nr:uncharacterized protein E1B28_000191 [Marasmius oreades]KAG7098224.1 hypothetical protein E1B28_000191 [Marasmius oreades]